MAKTKDEILEAISDMSVMELVELVKAMEEKFGVSAQATIAVATSTGGGASVETATEKTEFDVVLKSIGNNKIAVIKTVRAQTGLGLAEAKGLVEAAPKVVKEKVPKAEAEVMKKQLEEAGATAELE